MPVPQGIFWLVRGCFNTTGSFGAAQTVALVAYYRWPAVLLWAGLLPSGDALASGVDHAFPRGGRTLLRRTRLDALQRENSRCIGAWHKRRRAG